MRSFLTVGIDYLDKKQFRNIRNRDQFKPINGLWTTHQDINVPWHNPWIDYLIFNNHSVFNLKYGQYTDYVLPAVFFTLKKKARILIISSRKDVENLHNNYPYGSNVFFVDYEKLSADYDGIFFNTYAIFQCEHLDSEFFNTGVSPLCVNTLILFNLECIKYYQKSEVRITPYVSGNSVYLEKGTYRIEVSNKHLPVLDSSDNFGSKLIRINRNKKDI